MKNKFDRIFDMLDEMEADAYAESAETDDIIKYFTLTCKEAMIQDIRDKIEDIKDSD
jgi:hypothetical protein